MQFQLYPKELLSVSTTIIQKKIIINKRIKKQVPNKIIKVVYSAFGFFSTFFFSKPGLAVLAFFTAAGLAAGLAAEDMVLLADVQRKKEGLQEEATLNLRTHELRSCVLSLTLPNFFF